VSESLTRGEVHVVFSYVLIMDMFNSGRKWEGLLRGKFRYCLASERSPHSSGFASSVRPYPAWERRTSTCGRALLPHADKLMFVYVLELCKSEAKRAARSHAGHGLRHTSGAGYKGEMCSDAAGSHRIKQFIFLNNNNNNNSNNIIYV
jgi:hypothetical protein